jgi:hypothetical protein
MDLAVVAMQSRWMDSAVVVMQSRWIDSVVVAMRLRDIQGGGGGLAPVGRVMCKNLGCVTCDCKYSTLPFFWDQKNLGFGEAERKYVA